MRVFITGLGVACSGGYNPLSLRHSICCNAKPRETIFDHNASPVDFSRLVLPSSCRKDRLDTAVQLGLHSAHQAIQNAGIDFSMEDRENVAMFLSATQMGTPMLLKMHEDFITGKTMKPSDVFGSEHYRATNELARHYGFAGPSYCPVSSCASGLSTILAGVTLLKAGGAEIAVCGTGSDLLTGMGIQGFRTIKALGTDTRPFEADRDGITMAQGGGAVILQTEDSIRKYGTKNKIILEILGFGAATDSFSLTHPDPTGKHISRAMRQALGKSKSVDRVSAHATGTPVGDEIELKAINDTVKYKTLFALKKFIGHTIGASGPIALVVEAMLLKEGEKSLINSIGFGGFDQSLLVKKPTREDLIDV